MELELGVIYKIKNYKTATDFLEKAEKEGYIWYDGELPTEYNPWRVGIGFYIGIVLPTDPDKKTRLAYVDTLTRRETKYKIRQEEYINGRNCII